MGNDSTRLGSQDLGRTNVDHDAMLTTRAGVVVVGGAATFVEARRTRARPKRVFVACWVDAWAIRAHSLRRSPAGNLLDRDVHRQIRGRIRAKRSSISTSSPRAARRFADLDARSCGLYRRVCDRKIGARRIGQPRCRRIALVGQVGSAPWQGSCGAASMPDHKQLHPHRPRLLQKALVSRRRMLFSQQRARCGMLGRSGPGGAGWREHAAPGRPRPIMRAVGARRTRSYPSRDHAGAAHARPRAADEEHNRRAAATRDPMVRACWAGTNVPHAEADRLPTTKADMIGMPFLRVCGRSTEESDGRGLAWPFDDAIGAHRRGLA